MKHIADGSAPKNKSRKIKIPKFRTNDSRSIQQFLTLAEKVMTSENVTTSNDRILWLQSNIKDMVLVAKLEDMNSEAQLGGIELTSAAIRRGLIEAYTNQSADSNQYNEFNSLNLLPSDTPMTFFLRLFACKNRLDVDHQTGLITSDKLIPFPLVVTTFTNKIGEAYPGLAKRITIREAEKLDGQSLTKAHLEKMINSYIHVKSKQFKKEGATSDSSHVRTMQAQLTALQGRLQINEEDTDTMFHQINQPKGNPHQSETEDEELKETTKTSRRMLKQKYGSEEEVPSRKQAKLSAIASDGRMGEGRMGDGICYACREAFKDIESLKEHFKICTARRQNPKNQQPNFRQNRQTTPSNSSFHSSTHQTPEQKASLQFKNKDPNTLPQKCADVEGQTLNTVQFTIPTRGNREKCLACHRTFSKSQFWADHVQRCSCSFCILCGRWGHQKYGCRMVRCTKCKHTKHVTDACQFFESN
jgi:hypothetical protein